MSEKVFQNKWSGRLYYLVKGSDDKVVLRRMDGSKFEICVKELRFNYQEVNHDKKSS